MNRGAHCLLLPLMVRSCQGEHRRRPPRNPFQLREMSTQLLTGLGVHGPHVHFEGPHQGAAAQQVLGVNHLPGRTTSPGQAGQGPSFPGVGARPAGGGSTLVFLGTQTSWRSGRAFGGVGGSLLSSAAAPPALARLCWLPGMGEKVVHYAEALD